MKIKLKKGLKLNLSGAISNSQKIEEIISSTVAICPDDYPGFTPKVCIHEGDSVSVGSALLYDKSHPDIKLVSPVAGTVRAIIRGERRKILRVEIAVAPKEATNCEKPKATNGAEARRILAEAGFLALIHQRPFDIIASTEGEVRDIFVTTFDCAPLASPHTMMPPFFNNEDYEAGVALLKLITKGKVYISHDHLWTFGDIKGAEMVEFIGAYPASNPGVQAANIAPVNKGETIWTLDYATLGRIGKYVRTGIADWHSLIAITGPEVSKPTLVKATIGSTIKSILANRLNEADHHRRIISGNVLTGIGVTEDDYLHYPYRQITVIAEGDDKDEFMGWASLSASKMSESRSFPSYYSNKPFVPDARINGGRRAIIMSGEYDKYVPMDILPEYLIKAILAQDIENMEKLGIYEVAPEDFAAAEYADTSKLPLQAIVREGLDFLKKETE